MTEIQIFVVILYCISIAYIITTHGVLGAFRLIRDSLDQVVKLVLYGHKKPSIEANRPTCEVIHQIAKLETEIYGRVLSETVDEHIHNCRIHKMFLKQRKPV